MQLSCKFNAGGRVFTSFRWAVIYAILRAQYFGKTYGTSVDNADSKKQLVYAAKGTVYVSDEAYLTTVESVVWEFNRTPLVSGLRTLSLTRSFGRSLKMVTQIKDLRRV